MSDVGLHISSLLLRARPESVAQVTAEIEMRDGAEAAVSHESGKIIVTLESESESQIVDCLNTFSLLDGVVSASLVYHEFIPKTPEPQT